MVARFEAIALSGSSIVIVLIVSSASAHEQRVWPRATQGTRVRWGTHLTSAPFSGLPAMASSGAKLVFLSATIKMD